MQTYLCIIILYNKYGQVKGPDLSTIFEGKDLHGTRTVFAGSGFECWEEEGVDGLGGAPSGALPPDAPGASLWVPCEMGFNIEP